ncbi:class I SAM-dependent DNA methyltransferase [Paeniglutamicibacter psychrophenolicus]|uniref:site-specific DNA-methyltransferase (adenine-specific) n=1 Tax=Paeniglutamicibacter psychrophenolicus TaxID=257454 RepID=A0ABS4WGC3_9MICC|nr:class I SAM-dependent DNA methyltransferase [Paeniglutamicibacter psychrophenolicus]MBP2375220.1 type I restriction enzyme M protein [Paeniglutamicibacter psychrophenolicus]
MITGELKSQVDSVWNAFWTGGISNPLEIIEQITYLLFLKRLDDNQIAAERKASRTGKSVENPVFPEGADKFGRAYQDMRWSKFKNFDKTEMFTVFSESIFPFLREELTRQSDGSDSTYTHHMKDARFTITKDHLLQKAVDLIDGIPMDDRDTKGDLYEYMLSKIATAGTNGQFRTPRHIIKLLVAMRDPKPGEAICDPASGTCGFLMAAGEHLREHNPEMLLDTAQRAFFNNEQFHGFDFDSTMLRIGAMNLLLHGIENPVIENRDSLADLHSTDEEKYDVILANPPFAGSLDSENVSKELLKTVKTKKTELLFLALFLRLLKPGGRAAVIVPDGVLFGSSKAHMDLRRELVEGQQLEAVVKLPAGVFKPYAGVSTAVLFFTRTNSGGTENVWFYDVASDGFSLDDKRTPLESSDLPDVLERWKALRGEFGEERTAAELSRQRTERSFVVPKVEIAENGYDLSINRYKELQYEKVEHRVPEDIIADIEHLDEEIAKGLAELKGILA